MQEYKKGHTRVQKKDVKGTKRKEHARGQCGTRKGTKGEQEVI